MSLTRSEAVVALGKRLVACLKTEDDLLGGWMAHHLAELITLAETASPESRAEADAYCAAAVLEVWRYRNALPPPIRPLGALEPVIATLATLNVEPGDIRYHRELLRSAPITKAEGAMKQWLEVALGLDYSARLLIGFSLRAAAAEAIDPAEEWVELARQAGADEGPEVVLLRFLSPDIDAQEPQSRRPPSDLVDQARRLRDFAQLANKVADDIEARLHLPEDD